MPRTPTPPADDKADKNTQAADAAAQATEKVVDTAAPAPSLDALAAAVLERVMSPQAIDAIASKILAAASTKAAHNPVQRQFRGPEAHEAGFELPPVNLNPGEQLQEQLDIAEVVSPKDIEVTAFYEQRVTVVVEEDRAEDPMRFVTMNVNGEDCCIERGLPTTVKRKFVQQLLDMRSTGFTQPRRDYGKVADGNRLIPKTALLFPFQVVHDPHPHGSAWLKNALNRVFAVNRAAERVSA